METRADNDRDSWIHASPLFLHFPKLPNTVSLVITMSPNKYQSSEGQSTNSNHFWTNCYKIVKFWNQIAYYFFYIIFGLLIWFDLCLILK
jgi:hypothetical protein